MPAEHDKFPLPAREVRRDTFKPEHFPYEHEDGKRNPEAVAWLYNSEGTDRGFLARSLLRLEAELLAAQEREKALREALESADVRFEEILYAKGTTEQKVERMAQEAYFGQKESAKALAASPSEKPSKDAEGAKP